MRTPIRILIDGREVLRARVSDLDWVCDQIFSHLPALRKRGPVVVLAERDNVTTILMRA